MTDVLSIDLFRKNLTSKIFSWWVSYDYKSLEYCPEYDGPLCIDFYGRLHPKHSNGIIRLNNSTNLFNDMNEALLPSFDLKTDHRLLYRRIGLCAEEVKVDDGVFQLDLFTDYEKQEKEKALQRAMQDVRVRFGANAVFKGINMLEGATTLERNQQIGGHRA